MDDYVVRQILENYERWLVPKLGPSLRDDLLMRLGKCAEGAETMEEILIDYEREVLMPRFGKRWAATLYKNLERSLEDIEILPEEEDEPFADIDYPRM